MNSFLVGSIVFACTFGGAMLGMWLHSALPKHHIDSDSKDTVKVGIGLIATMTALVLGLVTASAKGTFDSVDKAVKQTSIEILALDRALARYGPETAEIRAMLKDVIGTRIDKIWPEESSKPAELDPMASVAGTKAEGIADSISRLKPQTEYQRSLQARASALVESLLQSRWIVHAGSSSSIPAPFLGVLLFWLTIIFTSFGMFAPAHHTVRIVLLVCALSVSSAVFLVLEMDTPFEGALKVSSAPLRYAHAHLNQ
jgi:hypothetical protein